MIAIDTNIVIHAHRRASARHAEASAFLERLAEGGIPWGLPVPVIGEFMRHVTHRAGINPSSIDEAAGVIDALVAAPTARVLSPGPHIWRTLRTVITAAGATGNLVHDAQIIAVCLEHGVDSIVSEDHGMRRFRGIRVLTLEDAS